MNLAEKILDLIFPPVCGFCDEIDNNYLCDKCKQRFKQIKVSQIDNYQNDPVYFDEHFYVFKYEKDVRDNILRYKFNEKSYLYKSYSKLIVDDEIFREKFIKKYDYIICVPLHKKRYRKRGYNQTKLIGEDIVKQCKDILKKSVENGYKIEYIDEVLIKTKNIKAQSSLDDKLDRIRNIQNSFSEGINIAKIKGKKIAIFDDIFTTGATVNECSKVLKNAGAEYVGVFTIAKAF